MFKKLVVLVLLICLISSVFSIRLVDPISKTLGTNNYIGSVAAGSELELIFSKEFGRFSSLELKSQLPNNFKVEVKDYLESIKLFITIPRGALKTDYSFDILMTGREEESATVYFIVSDNLLDSSLNNYFSESYVGQAAEYEFSLINNSHADVEFTISPKVPFSWISETKQTIVVPRKSVLKQKVFVTPQFAGNQNFDIVVESVEGKKDFSVLLNAKPTLVGKNKVFFNGFPFYSISLAPSYFFNSLIANFFN